MTASSRRIWKSSITGLLSSTSANRVALATVRALQTLGCEMEDLEVELVHEEPA